MITMFCHIFYEKYKRGNLNLVFEIKKKFLKVGAPINQRVGSHLAIRRMQSRTNDGDWQRITRHLCTRTSDNTHHHILEFCGHVIKCILK